jgi:hypothetical protein
LSSSASGRRCPIPAKRFSASEFAISHFVARCFISAVIAIADSVIAAYRAGSSPAASSAVKPTAAINRVWKDVSIIGTGSAITAADCTPDA